MTWGDVAMVAFACTMANHMGLVDAMERTIRHKLPVVNCIKCCSFWAVLLHSLLAGYGMVTSVAISFLAAFIAVWMELALGFIDVLYEKAYDWIYDAPAVTEADGGEAGAGAADAGGPTDALPTVRMRW